MRFSYVRAYGIYKQNNWLKFYMSEYRREEKISCNLLFDD